MALSMFHPILLKNGSISFMGVVLLAILSCTRNFQNPVFPEETIPWTLPVEPPLCSITADPTPVFSWNPIENCQTYEMEIDHDTAFSSPILRLENVPSSTCTAPNPLPNVMYFWHVRPKSGGGTWMDWSNAWCFVVDTAFSSPVVMHWVEGGSFQMGDTYGDGEFDEYPVHEVTLRTFAISRFEITQTQWMDVMGNNPSGFIGDGNLPVERITWYEVLEFCNALSQKAGWTSCYTINGTKVSCNFNADGYRLPTEAEWEYAVKGGNRSKGYRYSGGNDIDEVAWYYPNANNMTHPVGGKKANELGLYDMIGNVWEYCWDWWGMYLENPVQDLEGAEQGSFKIVRSSSWAFGYEWTCRPSSRF